MEKRVLETARALSMVVDQRFATMQAVATTLATSSFLVSGNMAAFSKQARTALQDYPDYIVAVSDATGQEFVNTAVPFGTPLPIRGALDVMQRVFATGKPAFTNLYEGTRSKNYVFGIHVPVFRDGHVVFDLDISEHPETFQQVFSQQHIPPEWAVAIHDANYVLAARSRFQERYVGRQASPAFAKRVGEVAEGTIEDLNPEGTRALSAFHRSLTSGWSVAIGIPKAVMLAEIWQWLKWIIGGVVLLSAAAIVLTVFLARRMARSIKALIAPAMALGSGERVEIGKLDLAEANEVGQSLLRASQLLQRRTADRKRAEKDLRQSEYRFSSIAAATFEGIAITEGGWIVEANGQLARMLGYELQEIIGQDVSSFILLEDRERVLANIRQGTESWIEHRMQRKDGSAIVVEAHGRTATYQDRAVRFTALRDITEHKQAEDALRESEAKMQGIVHSAMDAIISVDERQRIVIFNRAAEGIFQCAAAEALGTSLDRFLPPEYRPKHGEHVRKFGTSGIASRSMRAPGVLTAVRSNGEKFPIEATISQVQAGEAKLYTVILRDITERKQAEEEQVAAKELAENAVAQLRATIDSMTEGMFVLTPDRKRPLVNQAYFRIYGFEPDSSPDAAEKVGALLERYDMNGMLLPLEEQPGSLALRGETVVQREVRVRRVDTGREVITSVNCMPVRNASGKVVMAVITVEDITAKKQAEQALLRSEKLASVGRMAASIAHEINNPLAAMTNTLYLARTNAEDAASVRQYLDIADDELKRVSHITRQTLGFYRESSAPTPVSVSSVMDSAVDLLRGKIKVKCVTIEKQYDGDLQVIGVPGELRQVFSNLLTNSLDAIGEEGTIKLRVSTGPASNGNRRVRVTVADNGRGIKANLRSHLFEPFFTTKGTIGTGLGLWVSKQIIDKHGGTIRMRSSADGVRRGTVFSVVLPVEPTAAAHSQSAGA